MSLYNAVGNESISDAVLVHVIHVHMYLHSFAHLNEAPRRIDLGVLSRQKDKVRFNHFIEVNIKTSERHGFFCSPRSAFGHGFGFVGVNSFSAVSALRA